MAKPTGVSGSFRVHLGEDGQISGSFEQIPFSDAKAAVEKQMVERFIASMDKHLAEIGDQFLLSNPKCNPEDDFDFTVTSPQGLAYLELMEVAPLKGPYDQAPVNYKPYEFAKVILSGVLKKSEHYPKTIEQELFLLLYVTHWSFTLSDTTIACLRYWLKAQPTVFRAIFWYEPLDAEEGTPGWLYPVPPELLGTFDPKQVRENLCINLDPRKMKLVHEGKP